MIVALSAGRDSPQELRERLAYDEGRQRQILRSERPGVAELVVISTCHRTEVYATGDGPESDVIHAVAALLPDLQPTDHLDMKSLMGLEAVEHLFRVAAGLDSLVVGEPQVLGQARRAFVVAEEEGAIGPVLSNIFGRTLRLGRRVRAETPLGRLGMSVGTITTDHLRAHFDGLEGRAGAVVGAGEAAGDAARSLSNAGATISVIGRTPEMAHRLAGEIEGSAHPLEELKQVLARSDFAVMAVSGGILVGPRELPARSASDPFVVIDLSVPRSVEATGRDDVDLRSLEEMPGPRGPEVTAAVIDAEAMVKKEVAELARWADTRATGPLIRDLRSATETMVRDEVSKVLKGMDLDPEEAERVAALGMRIANKLLHGPSVALRDADETTREVIRKVFGLEG